MDEQKWWKECVVYQIYPQSFCDCNADGIGDLPGIIEKLDYLTMLGVDVLWISPFYPSPGYDNGYDISDYEAIAPSYGTMQDFERLLKEAHDRGLRVIIDMVVNHTSVEHPWFAEAIEGADAPKRDYYIWREPAPDGGPPNNWGALFGGPAWTLDSASGQYYLHLFSPQQPDLNWANPSLRYEVYAMMRRWLEKGIDGFRMDVISLIAKPEDYSNGPIGHSGFFDPRGRIASNPMLHEYLREMRREVLARADIMTVGEASAATLEDACILSSSDNSELDMVFQFEHMDLDGGETFKWTDCSIQLKELKQVMSKWQQGLDGSGWNALFWNNHDQPRMLSRLGDKGIWRERSAKMLATCLHMMKGTPFLYQGEELGMTNMCFESSAQLRDSESINAYEKYVKTGYFSKKDMLRYINMKSRDNARTPMQWRNVTGAGFTKGEPWMDINPNYKDINAAEQLSRTDSVFAYYQKLIRLRHEYKIIVYGKYIPYMLDHPSVYAYLRTLDENFLFVCCNFSPDYAEMLPPDCMLGEGTRQLLANCEDSSYLSDFKLAPYEAIVLFK